MADIERIYTVPLRSAYGAVRGKRSRKAVKLLRGFISRHMKAEVGNVSLSEKVNALIWKRGIQKPPRKIKVRAVKAGEDVSVLLVDEKVEEAKVEKAPVKKAPAAEKEAGAGASRKEKAGNVKEGGGPAAKGEAKGERGPAPGAGKGEAAAEAGKGGEEEARVGGKDEVASKKE